MKVEVEARVDLHASDVNAAIYHDNQLYTAGDDGLIKVWTSNLDPVASWRAHDSVVFDLAVNPDTGDVYSCSTDGEIRQWRGVDECAAAGGQLLATAIQTGPTGSGMELASLGDMGEGLQGTPVTVRRLMWRGHHLYAADELGSVCRWTSDLHLKMKKEYFTEIWSIFVAEGEGSVYTARDNDVIIADLTCKEKSADVIVTGSVPGRAPVVSNKGETMVVCVSRAGLEVEVFERENSLAKLSKTHKLTGHDMIVNCLLVDPVDNLVSAGWDACLVFWERKNGSYELKESVKVSSYVNVLCYGTDNKSVYAGGKNGYIVKVAAS